MRQRFSHNLLYLALVCCEACVRDVDAASGAGQLVLHAKVAQQLASERPYRARFGGSQQWKDCARPTDSTDNHLICRANNPDSAALSAAASSLATARNGGTANATDVAWAASLLDLAHYFDRQKTDAVVELLKKISIERSADALVLNDLAVAYLVRTVDRNDGLSGFAALDAIERAYVLDSLSPVVLFNRATILQQLHLNEAAAGAWEQFIRREPVEGWRNEGVQNLLAINAASRGRLARIQSHAWVDIATDDPQSAREWVINSALGEWGANILKGDSSQARVVYSEITEVGRIIAQIHGDSSVAHLAGALSNASTQTARAVIGFSEGTSAYVAGNLIEAAERLTPVARQFELERRYPLLDWTRVWLAGVSINQGAYDRADSLAYESLRHGEQRNDLALRGRSLLMIALGAARNGRSAESVEAYGNAHDLFSRARELSNAGSMLSQQADVYFLMGQDETALELQFRALQKLAVHQTPRVRAGPLLALGRQLGEVGLASAGVAVLREAALSGVKSERAPDGPEALIRLGAAEAAQKMSGVGSTHLRKAREGMARVKDPLMNERLSMELAAAEATMLSGSNNAEAIKRLDSVASFFARRRILYDAARPLVQAARLRLDLADTSGAEKNLSEAIRLLESQKLKPNDWTGARAVAAARHEIFTTSIAISLARSDTLGAFRLAERSRGSRIDAVPRLNDGQLAIAYALLPNRLILWSVNEAGLRMHTVTISNDSLARVVQRFEHDIRSGTSEDSAASIALFEILLKPIVAEINQARELTVTADGILGRVSFAGLRLPDKRMLFQQAEVSYATFIRPPTNASHIGGRVFLVGNPQFDTQLFRNLAPLSAADRETEQIRKTYDNVSVVTGAAATKTKMLDGLKRAQLFHFAGHAALVPGAPGLSHLVLAAQPGNLEDNTLTASEVRQKNLHHIALVVLSSCGTSQSGALRAANENGLVSAFLEAGVGGVVSSLWEVDDAGTSELMPALYRGLRVGASPARALREAQLSLLAEQSGPARSQAWLSFRVDVK